jgi:plastocyanin domain-containing protein
MSGIDWLVVAIATAAVVAVNWYFLGPKRAVQAAALDQDHVQRITIRVEGGYDPAVVEVAAGRPVELTFDRRETNPCSEEVVVSALGIRRELPAFQNTTIALTPPAPGRYEFTCGMGMLHGAIVAR